MLNLKDFILIQYMDDLSFYDLGHYYIYKSTQFTYYNS